jgi:exopolysaccharide biosynthesis WecB/TagA/CpsF family protein
MSLAECLASMVTSVAPDWEIELGERRTAAYLVTFANPFSVWVMQRTANYADLLARFDVVFADGILMARMASRIKACPVARLSFDGNSLAPVIFDLASRLGLTIAIVGGVPGVAEKAAEVFRARYPLNIVSMRSGYFSSRDERGDYCHQLAQLAPDIVICGMGAPHQEVFLAELADLGWRGVGFSCGGYLDQAAEGELQYYPQWVNRLHLRAPYRLLKEPRRLTQRYLIHYGPFYRSYLGLCMQRWMQR